MIIYLVRGKAAVMFDPTKLLPQNQTNVDLLIKQRKEQDENESAPVSPTSQTGSADTPASPSAPVEEGQMTHFSRPKVAGRRQVRIVQQDSTQRRQQVAVELVQSEKMYFVMLDAFAKSFLTPLKENSTSFGLQPSQVIALAETFEKIITFSAAFGNNPQLGSHPVAVFEESLTSIKDLYLLYLNKSIHHIFGLLNDLTGNKRFRQHVRHVQGELNTNIVEHFLIPTTRFSVYELLLRKYAQCSESDDQVKLIALADQIKDQSSEIMPIIEQLEKSGRILNLQLQLSIGSNVVYLWNPERQLIHEAVTMKSKINLNYIQSATDFENFSSRTHGENKRRILLFNDQLMWTTDLPDMRYKGHVGLVDITVEIFGPSDDVPSLLVKQAHSNQPQVSLDGGSSKQNKTNDQKEDGDMNKEAWVLVFEDAQVRNVWYREIKSLQTQLTNLTTDSTLTIPIEVKDETQGGCCTIM